MLEGVEWGMQMAQAGTGRGCSCTHVHRWPQGRTCVAARLKDYVGQPAVARLLITMAEASLSFLNPALQSDTQVVGLVCALQLDALPEGPYLKVCTHPPIVLSVSCCFTSKSLSVCRYVRRAVRTCSTCNLRRRPMVWLLSGIVCHSDGMDFQLQSRLSCRSCTLPCSGPQTQQRWSARL